MRYLLIPVRMAIVNKPTNNKCRRGCGEQGTLLHCWWECRLLQPLWKAVWRYLKKLKLGSAFWPTDSISGNLSKETWNTNSKEHKHPSVHCNFIYNHHNLEAVQVSVSHQMHKTIMGHLHNRLLLGHKKEQKVLPFLTAWMDLENIMLSQINQWEKDYYRMISLINRI